MVTDDADSPSDRTEPEFWKLRYEYRSWIIEPLIALVESLIDPRQRSCLQLQGLARLLLGLRRLPASSPYVAVILTLSVRPFENLRYVSVELGEDGLQFTDGGSVHTPGVGSDSYSNDVLALWPSGNTEGDDFQFDNWLSEAQRMLKDGAHVSVEDLLEDEIDWDESAGEDRWVRPRERY
jgi:hypothetical protein